MEIWTYHTVNDRLSPYLSKSLLRLKLGFNNIEYIVCRLRDAHIFLSLSCHESQYLRLATFWEIVIINIRLFGRGLIRQWGLILQWEFNRSFTVFYQMELLRYEFRKCYLGLDSLMVYRMWRKFYLKKRHLKILWLIPLYFSRMVEIDLKRFIVLLIIYFNKTRTFLYYKIILILILFYSIFHIYFVN